MFSLKELPRTLTLILLAMGASLILGFLSFSGMFAMIPALSFAIGAFVLAVAYEFEIYFQNIQGSFKKLLKFNYLENNFAESFLNDFKLEENSPQFFKDYENNQAKIEELQEKIKQIDESLAPEEKRQYQQEKAQRLKLQKTMTKWFAKQLFAKKTSKRLDTDLSDWLEQHKPTYQKQLTQQQTNFFWIKAFSFLTAIFMTLSSTYLIGEALTIIPWVATLSPAALPFLVLFMSVLAGAAYGFLTFNTISDFFKDGFLNNTIVKWGQKLSDDLQKGVTLGKITMVVLASLLGTLAFALTVFTAGTWLTIAKTSRPLFSWMQKIPLFIMGYSNAAVTGLASFFFTLENTSESLEMLYNLKDTVKDNWNELKQNFKATMANENAFQRFNPIRILLKLTITPIRFTLFTGHLLSFAFTADRIEHVPKFISQLIALLSEGFEDASYFIGQAHDDEPQSQDLPTKAINAIASPLYALAALWDSFFSRFNQDAEKQISFKQAWQKHTGQRLAEPQQATLNDLTPRFSLQWEKESAISSLEKIIRRLQGSYGNEAIKQEKITALKEGIRNIRAIDNASNAASLSDVLTHMSKQEVFRHQRFSFFAAQTTQTTEELVRLSNRFAA